MGTVYFPGAKNGQGVKMTLYPLIVPWSRKSRATPLLPLWAIRPVQSLSACTYIPSIHKSPGKRCCSFWKAENSLITFDLPKRVWCVLPPVALQLWSLIDWLIDLLIDWLALGSSPYGSDAPRPYKRPFVPHNLISDQWSPVTLPKFQMSPRFKFNAYGSKKNKPKYALSFSLKVLYLLDKHLKFILSSVLRIIPDKLNSMEGNLEWGLYTGDFDSRMK